MTEKYYLCTIIGDGTERNPHRPKIADYPIKSFGRTVDDESGWCLCWVEAEDHSIWADDPDIGELKEF